MQRQDPHNHDDHGDELCPAERAFLRLALVMHRTGRIDDDQLVRVRTFVCEGGVLPTPHEHKGAA